MSDYFKEIGLLEILKQAHNEYKIPFDSIKLSFLDAGGSEEFELELDEFTQDDLHGLVEIAHRHLTDEQIRKVCKIIRKKFAVFNRYIQPFLAQCAESDQSEQTPKSNDVDYLQHAVNVAAVQVSKREQQQDEQSVPYQYDDRQPHLEKSGDVESNPGPGIKATPVEKKSGLSCVHCKFLLKNPVQTDEGERLCEVCYLEIQRMPGPCVDCGVSVDVEENAFPDRAVARELAALLVYCDYKQLGCDWVGPLKEWESHCAQCDYGVHCPNVGCSEILKKEKLEEHLLSCLYRLEDCKYCGENMVFAKMEEHHESCEEFPISCDDCQEIIARIEFREHKLKSCIIEECLICHKKVYRKIGRDVPSSSTDCNCLVSDQSKPGVCAVSGYKAKSHRRVVPDDDEEDEPSPCFSPLLSRRANSRCQPVSVPYDNFRYHQTLALRVVELEDLVATIMTENNQRLQDIHDGHDLIRNLQNKITKLNEDYGKQQTYVASLETELSQTKEKMQVVSRKPGVDKNKLQQLVSEREQYLILQRKDLDDVRRQLTNLTSKIDSNAVALQELQLKSHVSLNLRRPTTVRDDVQYGGVISETRFIQLEHRVEDLARETSTTRAHLQELEIQLQAQVAATYNGSFLWRIPDVAKRRRDALEDRIISIYSPAFYTGRHGYKMCCRMYFKGGGMGLTTHTTVFLIVMQGNYDALLKWPFVDPSHRKHIVQNFKAIPDSSSFQRPLSDMNVASGCPQFASTNDSVVISECLNKAVQGYHRSSSAYYSKFG